MYLFIEVELHCHYNIIECETVFETGVWKVKILGCFRPTSQRVSPINSGATPGGVSNPRHESNSDPDLIKHISGAMPSGRLQRTS